MLLKDTVNIILEKYRRYDDILSEETKLLIANDYSNFKSCVEKKIAMINDLVAFEQERVNQYGEVTLNDLIERSADTELNQKKEELVKVLKSINDKTEKNQILMDQINAYKNMFMSALSKQTGGQNSYSKSKKYDQSSQTANILNKRL
jgi:mevalonate kinase